MAAEHGGAMAVGGEAEAALPELGRWHKREHNLKEGEAELQARDCRPRGRSRGELRRRVRGCGRRPATTRGGVDGAWPPRGGHALPRSGARRGASAGRRAEVGQAWRGTGLGQARRGARRRLAGPASVVGQKRGGGPRRRKSPFPNIFSRNFYMPSFKYYFEQENDIF